MEDLRGPVPHQGLASARSVPLRSSPAAADANGSWSYGHAVAGTFHVERAKSWPPPRESSPARARRCRRRTSPTSGASERSVCTRHGASRLPQKLCQRRDVQAESSSGKPRLDLLEEPAVAVRITERCEREIGAHVSGPDPARVPSSRRHGGGCPRSGIPPHVDAVSDELGACGLDVIDDEERPLNRARHGGRESLAEHDGAW